MQNWEGVNQCGSFFGLVKSPLIRRLTIIDSAALPRAVLLNLFWDLRKIGIGFPDAVIATSQTAAPPRCGEFPRRFIYRIQKKKARKSADSEKSCNLPRFLIYFRAMKKFASILFIALTSCACVSFAAQSDSADLREKTAALEKQVAELKATIAEQAKFDAEIIAKLRAENRALKKQLRGVARGKITAEQAEKTAAKASAKTTAEKAKAVEKKTEERISEKESESDTGFHMFPF